MQGLKERELAESNRELQGFNLFFRCLAFSSQSFLSLTLTLALAHTLTHSHTHTLTLTLTRSHTHTLTHTRKLTHPHSGLAEARAQSKARLKEVGAQLEEVQSALQQQQATGKQRKEEALLVEKKTEILMQERDEERTNAQAKIAEARKEMELQLTEETQHYKDQLDKANKTRDNLEVFFPFPLFFWFRPCPVKEPVEESHIS